MIAGEMRAVAELNAEHGFMPILLRGIIVQYSLAMGMPL